MLYLSHCQAMLSVTALFVIASFTAVNADTVVLPTTSFSSYSTLESYWSYVSASSKHHILADTQRLTALPVGL